MLIDKYYNVQLLISIHAGENSNMHPCKHPEDAGSRDQHVYRDHTQLPILIPVYTNTIFQELEVD